MRIRLFAATTAAATALALAPAASADPAPVTGVELNQPADQVIAVEAKFDLTADYDATATKIRELRGKMWDQNVPFLELRGPGNTRLRDVAAKNGLTTRQQYVDAMQYDNGLSRIALQRAAEASKLFDHKRQFNATCSSACGSTSTATFNGIGPSGENLHGASNTARAVGDWGMGEVAELKRANGEFNTKNGHLYNLINPANRSYGIAGVVTAEGEASAAVFSLDGGAGGTRIDGEQRTVLHRPANTGEKPNTTPKKLILGGASTSEIRRIISIVLTVLTIVTAVVNFIGPQLRPLVDQFLRR